MPRIVCAFLCFLLLSLAAPALCAAPRLNGPVQYEIVNQETQITLSADLIDDSSKENATGTLELQIWACAEPYEGDTIHGTMLATAKFEGLSAGQVYRNYRRTVPYTAPARGNYYLVMVLLEYHDGAYLIEAHTNFNGMKNLGPLPLFTLERPWDFQTSYEGGTVDMSVAKISHRRTGVTGTLKLAVWATAGPYHGGALNGYELGVVKKEALKPGFTYDNVKNVAKLVLPPPGDYYVSLILYEYDHDEYEIVAHLDSDHTYHFN